MKSSNKKRKKNHKSSQNPTTPSSRPPKIDHKPKTPETHQQALDLSQQLRQLSNQKRLRECLNHYNSPEYDDIRDAHHGSIVIDCCARCGDMDEAERVVSAMLGYKSDCKSEDSHIWEKHDDICSRRMPIQAWTALLKGYVHGGMMAKADSLFNALCSNRSGDEISGGSKKRKRSETKDNNAANVRTLNTLLRGCLWSATSMNSDMKGFNTKKNKRAKRNVSRHELVGGVVAAERAWELFNNNIHTSDCDSSSYEYFITLLCQSLQCEKAELHLKQMKKQFHLSNNTSNCDPTLIESMVVCLVALSRGYALLGKMEDAKRCTKQALAMIQSLESPTSATESGSSKKKSKHIATGGKQAWKSDTDGGSFGRREQSNTLFRSHRISELKTEAYSLDNHSNRQDMKCLARTMMTRLLYFSGGGTTGLNAIAGINLASKDEDAELNKQRSILQWYNSLWYSFGLKSVVQSFDHEHKIHAIGESSNNPNPPLTIEMCNHLRARLLGKDHHVLTTDGYIDFARVFSTSTNILQSKSPTSKQVPLHIELGSGSGDWATVQAELNPAENYATVELRADRVAQTFAKVALNNQTSSGSDEVKSKGSELNNLCCVGAECGSFLRERIRPQTVRTVFVNHPEPPTQTSTSVDEQAHMLNSETILEAAKCLEPDGKGRIIIVTDNLIYARLIGRTIAKVLDQSKLSVVEPDEISDLRKIETASDSGHSVHIYEGKPSSSIGHYTPKSHSGTSYFDRLWRTGAGKHADMKKRFIIAVRTVGNVHQYTIKKEASRAKKPAATSVASGKVSKKKSADKQQRRNERRLLKKQQQQQSHSACSK